MAAELATPTDERTGLPYPIIVTEEPRLFRVSHEKTDENHAFHPKKKLLIVNSMSITEAEDAEAEDEQRLFTLDANVPRVELELPQTHESSIALAALRACRVQDVPYSIHHRLYHDRYKGPDLPRTMQDIFRTVVFAAAGYIPEAGISFDRNGEPYTRPISAEERARLWSQKVIRVDSVPRVRNFIGSYLLAQDSFNDMSYAIEDFLTTPSEVRRWELGNMLLGQAAILATDSIKDDYKEAKQAVLLPPENVVMRTAARLTLSCLGIRKHRMNVLRGLELRYA